jgi:hypothetical protein
VKEKYLTLLKDAVILSLIQNSQTVALSQYTIYMVVEYYYSKSSTPTNWTIFKIIVNSFQSSPGNYQFSILSFV